MKLQDINDRILKITIKDVKYKSTDELLLSLLEELGELATELKIENKVFGNLHKVPDEGSIGESIDLYICCMSLFYNGYILNGQLTDEKEVSERLALLKMKDTFNFPTSSSYYIAEIIKYINGPARIYIEAAQIAINIFFKATENEELFYEIANKKLNKWENSQSASIKNMAS
jgi:hypothetical protein